MMEHPKADETDETGNEKATDSGSGTGKHEDYLRNAAQYSTVEILALAVVIGDGPIMGKDVGEELARCYDVGVESRAYRTLSKLEDLGHVEFRRDGATKLYRATEHGELCLEAIHEYIGGHIQAGDRR